MPSDLPRPRAWGRDADINVLCTRSTRSPRSNRNRSNEPETCRQSSIAHTRSLPRPRAQRSSAAAPLAPDWTVCSPSCSPEVDETAAIVCDRLWVSAPSTIIGLRPPPLRPGWTPGGHGLLGAVPRSYQVTPKASSTGDERHSERQSGPAADSLKESQLAAGRGAFTSRRTSPTSRIETASLNGAASKTIALVTSRTIGERSGALLPLPRGGSGSSDPKPPRWR